MYKYATQITQIAHRYLEENLKPVDIFSVMRSSIIQDNDFGLIPSISLHQELTSKVCEIQYFENVSNMLFPDNGGDTPVPNTTLFLDSGFKIADPPPLMKCCP